MTTYASESLVTEWYKALMPGKTGLFMVVEISPTTLTIDGDEIRNSVSIERATLAPPAKFAERQFVSMPDDPVENRDDKATKAEDKLPQENALTRRANTLSTAFCIIWAKVITLNSPCAGTGKNRQKISFTHLNISPTSSLLS